MNCILSPPDEGIMRPSIYAIKFVLFIMNMSIDYHISHLFFLIIGEFAGQLKASANSCVLEIGPVTLKIEC